MHMAGRDRQKKLAMDRKALGVWGALHAPLVTHPAGLIRSSSCGAFGLADCLVGDQHEFGWEDTGW